MLSLTRNTTLRRASPLMMKYAVRYASTDGNPPLMTKIREGLKVAMREGNTIEKTVIRSIISEVKNKTINDSSSVGTDLKLHGLLRTMIVSRKKSIAEYDAAGRQDLVDKESSEIEVLKKYAGLVSVASDDDLDKKVKEIISTLPEADQKSMSKIMGTIPWKDVETKWNSSRNAVAGSVKRVLGVRSFSTSARQLNHSNPLVC